MIRRCDVDGLPSDFDAILALVNDAARAYRGVIAADCWKEPYMPREELEHEIASGVDFWGIDHQGRLASVMGLQPVADVALIRHAYTSTALQGTGMGTKLLAYLRQKTDRPLLVGTWKAASWAIRFYEGRGFRLVSSARKDELLRRYWHVPERQIEESVVLAEPDWLARAATSS